MPKTLKEMRFLSASWPVVLLAPLLMGVTGQVTSFDERVLAAHNRERASLGLRPLRWNHDLVVASQKYADQLAVTNNFKHSSAEVRGYQGENLWRGTKGYFSLEAMVDAWVREKEMFVQGAFPLNSTTGRVGDVGHYTQIVWRTTSDVGCAIASGPAKDILVCRYSEPGNIRGEYPY